MEYHQNGAPTLIQIPLLIPSPIDPSYPLSRFSKKRSREKQQILFTESEKPFRSISFTKRATPREAQRYHGGDLRRGLASIRYIFISGSKQAGPLPTTRQTRGARVKIHEA